MSTLTNTKIKDTYDGLLKTTDRTTGLPATEQVVIQDGVGNDSSLSLGQATEGASINGRVDDAGDVYVDNNVECSDSITASNDIESGNDMVGNDLQVTGAASVQGNIIVNGATARVGIRNNSPPQELDVIGSTEVSGREKI